jgi:hypothetical protein
MPVSDEVAWHGLGRLLHLVRLLGKDLVARSASGDCSTGTCSPAMPHKVSQQGLGRLLHLARLLDRDLVACFISQGCSAGTSWASSGHQVPRFPTSSLEPLRNSLGVV